MMTSAPLIEDYRIEKLSSRISQKVQCSTSKILPYADYTEFLTDLLRVADNGNAHLYVGGLATAETALAADRAGLELREIVGSSPFSIYPEKIIEALSSTGEIVILSNPNRLTGANFGLVDLELLARAIPNGLLIVDEHYFDFYGITAVKLLEKHTNVAILRSPTGAFGINSDQSGFAVTAPIWIEKLKQFHNWDRISFTLYKILLTSLSSSEVLSLRLKALHEESLRLTKALNKLKIQSRLSATDFILVRVANPTAVCRYLESHKVEVRPMDHIAGLKQYLSYRIQSTLTNENFLQAMNRMPIDYYRLEKASIEPVRLRRPSETTPQPSEPRVVVRDHIFLMEEEPVA